MEDFIDFSVLSELACGVYALYQDDELVYIGSSKNMIQRIYYHRNDKQLKFNRVVFKSYPLEEARRIETKLISKYQPIMNVVDKQAPILPNIDVDLKAIGIDVTKFTYKDVARGKGRARMPLLKFDPDSYPPVIVHRR